MKLARIMPIGTLDEQGEPEVDLPTEGDDAFGARLQVIVLTDNGLEMKCFQY